MRSNSSTRVVRLVRKLQDHLSGFVLADGLCCIESIGTGVVMIEQLVFVFAKGLRVV